MRHHALALAVLLLAPGLAACDRQPDAASAERVVAERLHAAFSEATFAIADFRRMGRAPLPAIDGRARRIVYFHARLEALRDWDAAAWDGLNLGALSQLLGATEAGVRGLGPTGIARGGELAVDGSVSYVASASGWEPVAFVPRPIASAPPQLGPAALETKALIERLEALLERAGSVPQPTRSAIVSAELDRAMLAIDLRLRRYAHEAVIASGPESGTYQEVAGLLAAFETARGRQLTAVASEGSIANARLVERGDVGLGLVQSNIAQLALAGAGPFATDGPLTELRALASLFPEAVQVVVLADAPFRSVAELSGKRAVVGRPGSGSRLDALRLLAAEGAPPETLAALIEADPTEALGRLARGEADAVILTATAPTRALQRLAAGPGMRLLGVGAAARERLAADGFVPVTLAASTYPGQTATVETVAVSALLVAHRDMPQGEVEAVLRALFQGVDWIGSGSVAGTLIALPNARRGLTLPLHPAAARWLEAARPGG